MSKRTKHKTVKMNPLPKVRSEVAREHALTMRRVALSREDECVDETLTNSLIYYFPHQVSSHYKIVQLPKEISVLLASVLQKMPIREQLREEHTRTNIRC